jgi:hypothetical protein
MQHCVKLCCNIELWLKHRYGSSGSGTVEFPNNKCLGLQGNYYDNHLCTLTFSKVVRYEEKPLLVSLICGSQRSIKLENQMKCH